MLGHQLLRTLSDKHDVHVTLRRTRSDYDIYGLFTPENSHTDIDARELRNLISVFDGVQPDIVVNAIGIVKQRGEANDWVESLEVNALLPHRLASLCRSTGVRLIHVSTDCVFSGRKGNYRESDMADADDIYGRTKHIGEVAGDRCLTLRTSIIGLELHRRTSLIEWYLAQKGVVRGYTRAIFTGFTTAEIARVIDSLIVSWPQLSGVWHVASPPVSKHDLLSALTQVLGRTDITIVPDAEFVCDRSLDGSKFISATGYVAPDWRKMLLELAEEIKGRPRT